MGPSDQIIPEQIIPEQIVPDRVISDEIIAIRGLGHTYASGGGAHRVLHALDLDVRPGEVVVVTGASGAGKTTLLTLCGALRSVQTGDVRVLGSLLNNLRASHQRALRAAIGFIFQSHNLIEALTAGQNVVMSLMGRASAAEAERLAEEALAALGLSSRIDALPESLSGGERQRVAVARALVRRPRLILADEPTASLDDVSARVVINALRSTATRTSCAVLVVTHDARLFGIADRMWTLRDGALIADAVKVRAR
jgi:putative ABC transport system ATP-binding protein